MGTCLRNRNIGEEFTVKGPEKEENAKANIIIIFGRVGIGGCVFLKNLQIRLL